MPIWLSHVPLYVDQPRGVTALRTKTYHHILNGSSKRVIRIPWSADATTYQKPLFFNIALNYVELDMDRLQQRAGKEPSVALPPTGTSATGNAESIEKKSIPKAKAEEPLVPNLNTQQPSRSGLSSLLGGWWSK